MCPVLFENLVNYSIYQAMKRQEPPWKCKATIRFGVGIDRLGNAVESLRHEVICAGNVLIFNGEVAEKQSSVTYWNRKVQ